MKQKTVLHHERAVISGKDHGFTPACRGVGVPQREKERARWKKNHPQASNEDVKVSGEKPEGWEGRNLESKRSLQQREVEKKPIEEGKRARDGCGRPSANSCIHSPSGRKHEGVFFRELIRNKKKTQE